MNTILKKLIPILIILPLIAQECSFDASIGTPSLPSPYCDTAVRDPALSLVGAAININQLDRTGCGAYIGYDMHVTGTINLSRRINFTGTNSVLVHNVGKFGNGECEDETDIGVNAIAIYVNVMCGDGERPAKTSGRANINYVVNGLPAYVSGNSTFATWFFPVQ